VGRTLSSTAVQAMGLIADWAQSWW